MQNIIVKVPEGAFDAAGCDRLGKGITTVAKQVEQIGDDPRQEFTTWVVIEEVKASHFFAGGNDPLSRVVPVIVLFYAPAGLIDDAFRCVEEHDDGYHSRQWIVAAREEMAGLDLFDHNPGGELLTGIVANLLHLLCDGGNAFAQTVAAGGVERTFRHLHNDILHNDLCDCICRSLRFRAARASVKNDIKKVFFDMAKVTVVEIEGRMTSSAAI